MCAISAIASPVFQPAMRIITAISLSSPAVVTTSFPHNYGTGLIVRLDIPPAFGMTQINQQVGTIAVLSATTFAIDIDSTYYDALVTPSGYPQNAQLPQVVPVAEINASIDQAVRNVLPL